MPETMTRRRTSAPANTLIAELRALGDDALVTRRDLAELSGCRLSAIHSWFARLATPLPPTNVPGSAHAYRVGDLLAVMLGKTAD